MATSTAKLVSFGDVAKWIDESVTTMLIGTITPIVSSVTEKIMPVVGVGVSIALLWYAWMIMNGTIQTPILQATKRMVNIVAIVTIAGAGGLYQTDIATTMLDLPTAVNELFSGEKATPAKVIDDIANRGSEISTKMQKRAPTGLAMLKQAIIFVVIALIITVISAIMSAIGMIILVVTKVGMGLVVVLGPLCILALLFEPTKAFFSAWLRQAVFYSLYTGLFMLVLTFITDMFGRLQDSIINSSDSAEINVFGILTAIILFVACSVFILNQVSQVASQVSGGRGGGLKIPFVGQIG